MKLSELLKSAELNGNRKMLGQVFLRFGDCDLAEELVNGILTSEISLPEIRRQITSGRGVGKSHCSEQIRSAKWWHIREGRKKRS